MSESREHVTGLLLRWRSGDASAFDQLVPILYEDLRRLARFQRRGSPSGETLATTALVHEAYLRLIDERKVDWADRSHFLAIAARTMRRVIVDHLRARGAAKRGSGDRPVTLDPDRHASADDPDEILVVSQVLDRLADIDPRLVEVVECRFFAGLTEEETAEALGVSSRTVQRDWKRARAWLLLELGAGSGD